MSRRRLDQELVRRGLAESRQLAQRLIADGSVLVNGSFAAKAARMVAPADQILVQSSGPAYVSRSGYKLAEGLDFFGVDPTSLDCLDVGSSTGGFTDCLLQRGAAHVVAVDVGTHQLHERVRSHPRVFVLEQTDIRALAEQRPDLRNFDLAVIDVSFISLRQVIPAVSLLLKPSGRVLALIKPQFEAGRQEASRSRGVITDVEIWLRTVREVLAAGEVQGLAAAGLVACSTRGTKGNVEFMTLLGRNGPTISPRDQEIERTVREAALSGAAQSAGESA